MRFYDSKKGSILLDRIDIREIDLYWLRSKIGYIGQEPVLFSGSIKDNLLMGNSNATS
jgi:ATP-binding cassette subfamily B (MDR/TAP) protein 1